MTLDKLIEQLTALREQCGGDTEVRYTYNAGDYWRTEVAETPTVVDLIRVVHSDYHQKDTVLDEDAENEDGSTLVVGIS
jgi:hypothetical protein